jgi:hypothetical protein
MNSYTQGKLKCWNICFCDDMTLYIQLEFNFIYLLKKYHILFYTLYDFLFHSPLETKALTYSYLCVMLSLTFGTVLIPHYFVHTG